MTGIIFVAFILLWKFFTSALAETIFLDPVEGCGIRPIVVNATSGTISSRIDGQSGHYLSNRTCTWLLIAPKPKIISFRFTHLDLEVCTLPGLSHLAPFCTCDHVSIYNGVTDNSPLITKQCGKMAPTEAFTTSDNQGLVMFSTDSDHEWTGFSLDFEATDADDIPCKLVNVVAGRKSGTIKSYVSSTTQTYRPNEDCKWRIDVNPKYVIRFTFTFYQIQECPDCSCDSVSLYEGILDLNFMPYYCPKKTLAKQCGDSTVGRNWTYVTSSYRGYVHFQTDGAVQKTGFALAYQQETREDNTPCTHTATIVTNTSGIIQNFRRSADGKYRSGEECGWVINAQDDDMFIRLRFLSMDIQECEDDNVKCSCDSISIFSGRSRTHVTTLCGTNYAPTELVFVAESSMLVHFSTDAATEQTGFVASYEVFYPEDLPCDNLTIHNVDGAKAFVLRSPRRKSGFYRPNEKCDWVLSGPRGYILRIDVKYVEFGECSSQTDCNGCHSLKVYDGVQPKKEKLLATHCNKLNCTGPFRDNLVCRHFTTKQESAYIRFQAESVATKQGAGFEIEIAAVADDGLVPRTDATDTKNVSYDSAIIVAAIAALICVVSFVIIAGIYWHSYRKRRPSSDCGSELERYITITLSAGSLQSIVAEYGGEEMGTMMEHLNIDSKDLTIGSRIGEGQFGIVYSGSLKHSNGSEEEVAVKSVKSAGSESVIAFLKEALIMQNMDHPNVLRLIGVAVIEEQPHMVFPFMKNGSLQAFLRENHEQIAGITLSHFCLQICRGMNYLTKQKCIHRDLASRNVLVSAETVLKIADFGLARDINNSGSYYWSSSNARLLPVRWHPPESILQRTFEEKSDVWSFGIVCWEIFAKCLVEPYVGMTNEEVIDFVCNQNQRLAKPDNCSEEMYNQIMLKCWIADRNERPAFSDLLPLLKSYNMTILET